MPEILIINFDKGATRTGSRSTTGGVSHTNKCESHGQVRAMQTIINLNFGKGRSTHAIRNFGKVCDANVR